VVQLGQAHQLATDQQLTVTDHVAPATCRSPPPLTWIWQGCCWGP